MKCRICNVQVCLLWHLQQFYVQVFTLNALQKKHTLLYDIFNGCKTAYLFKSNFMRDIFFLNIIHSKLSIARNSAMKNVCMDMGTPYRIRKRIIEHTYTIQYTIGTDPNYTYTVYSHLHNIFIIYIYKSKRD